ncbi:MAG: hypothetical protein K9L30_18985, partial [Desulfobacterales bacterium]|nr:hypothetical protein [Desulfobacterales bacterium]
SDNIPGRSQAQCYSFLRDSQPVHAPDFLIQFNLPDRFQGRGFLCPARLFPRGQRSLQIPVSSIILDETIYLPEKQSITGG